MILKEEKLLETDGNIDEENQILVKISEEEASKLFDLLFSSYSNPKTALMREYTSNAWDANKEIDSTEPVIVRIAKDDGGYFIEFIDKGVGMTEKFVKKVFSQLLKSTKTIDNSQIGGYGIGSKSGLGYQNQVLITTIKDEVSNNWLLFRDDSGCPKMNLMSSNIVKEESSGTTIKIYLIEDDKDVYYEHRKEYYIFAQEAGKELGYFDNVIFDFKDNQIRQFADNYNKGKIIEGNYFKYRTSSQYSDEFHIVLGKVAYPIDWKVLGISRIPISVGIKFEIGELQVNMTREAIRYSDETKELIIKRIELAKQELIDLYNKDNKPIESLFEYIRATKKFEEEREHFIKFTIPAEGSDNIIPGVYPLPALYKLNVSCLKDTLNSIVFKPFLDLPLPINLKRKILPYFFLNSNWKVEDGREKKNGVSLANIYNNDLLRIVFYKDRDIQSKEFRKYIQNCYFVKQDKINYKTDYNNWKEILGLYSHNIKVSKTIIEYRKIIIEALKKECSLWIDYDNFEIPQSWKDEQKAINRAILKKPKLEGIISVKRPSCDYEEFNLKSLKNFIGTIIYGFREEKEQLEHLYQLLAEVKITYKKYHTTYNNRSICDIFQISKQNVKLLKDTGFKIYHISQIMELKQIRRFLTYLYIKNNPNIQLKTGEVKLFNEFLGNLYKEVSKYYSDNSTRHEDVLRELVSKYYSQEQIEVSIDPIIKYKLDLIDKYFKGAELIRYVSVNEENLPFVIDYLKIKKKAVNLEFYKEGKGIEKIEKKKSSIGILIPIERKEYDRNIPKVDPNIINLQINKEVKCHLF